MISLMRSNPARAATLPLTMRSWAIRKASFVKLDILLNGDVCDAMATIVHKDKAYARGRAIAEKSLRM